MAVALVRVPLSYKRREIITVFFLIAKLLAVGFGNTVNMIKTATPFSQNLNKSPLQLLNKVRTWTIHLVNIKILGKTETMRKLFHAYSIVVIAMETISSNSVFVSKRQRQIMIQ